MLTIQEAITQLQHKAITHIVNASERLRISDILGRVLAEDITSSIDVPPKDNSAMDGYAIHTAAITSLPITLPVSQRIAAGDIPKSLVNGDAARIFTGADIPIGANCVVMQENCHEENGYVTIKEGIGLNKNIRQQGQDIRKNHIILSKGHQIKPQDIGLLAAIGLEYVEVFRPLRVSIVTTGSELLEPGAALCEGHIYDSNRPMIEAVCRALHCDIVASVHIKDSLSETVNCFNKLSANCDFIISCGGVSVGEEDHVKQALRNLGTLDLWKIKMKPGKPLAFGEINRASMPPCPLLALPGNPVSAFVTFHLFGKVMIKAMQSVNAYAPVSFYERANFTTDGKNKRPEFMRVKQTEEGLVPFPNQSSGVLSSICWADALAFIPEETAVKRGDSIKVFPI